MQKKITSALIACVLMLLLCAQNPSYATKRYSQKFDSAPRINVDVSKIPNAVPKAESLSPIGNLPEYTVQGKQYHVLNNVKNYKKVGIASWYGTKFHHHLTSSGEMYNMYQMTAAHRSLPLPTYLQVTNLENHKKVIVKVNDRGPFYDNRLIDLSYAAAKKLGMLAHGTAKVEITAIVPEKNADSASDEATERADTFEAKSKYYVQAGAFHNTTLATRLSNKIRKHVRRAVIIRQQKQENHPPLSLVHIGPFNNFSLTKQIFRKLKTAGLCDPIIVMQ